MNNRNTQSYVKTILSESNQKLILRELKKSKHFSNIDRFKTNTTEVRNIRIIKEDVDKMVADISVENNLPAEKEPIVRNHLMTLLQFSFPPLTVYRIINNILKGNYLEAFKNIPVINIFLVPEALYELVMSGISFLPKSMKNEIIQNKYVKSLLKLLFSLKEVQKSEDIDIFYENLKSLLSASGHALVTFAAFLAACAGLCGAIVQFEGLIAAITSFIMAITGGAALGVLIAISAGIATFCAALAAAAAGTGAVAFLINVVSKLDPDQINLNDKKFQKELDEFTKKMAQDNKDKFEKEMSKIPSKNQNPSPTPTSDSIIIDTKQDSDDNYQPKISESIDLKLWHRIAGL